MPKRIQRRRTSGWRMPEGAIYVGRPSTWGNPFDFRAAAAVGYGGGRGAPVDAFVGWLHGEDWGVPNGQTRESMAAKRAAIWRGLHALAGKDLACWCPLDRPCHADVLLRIANADADPEQDV